MEKHEIVRTHMMNMQKVHGAAIKPIGLNTLFFDYLNKHYKSKMNKIQARNITDVFCALCNEFYLLNLDTQRSEFYMSDSKWRNICLVESL